MSAAWFCPGCQKYHAPHVDTCPAGADIPPSFTTTTVSKRVSDPNWRCFECGKPAGECDPEGVGHYRG